MFGVSLKSVEITKTNRDISDISSKQKTQKSAVSGTDKRYFQHKVRLFNISRVAVFLCGLIVVVISEPVRHLKNNLLLITLWIQDQIIQSNTWNRFGVSWEERIPPAGRNKKHKMSEEMVPAHYDR